MNLQMCAVRAACVAILVGGAGLVGAADTVRHGKNLGNRMPTVTQIINALKPPCDEIKGCVRGPGGGGEISSPIEAAISSSLVSFETGSSRLTPEASKVLDIFAQALQDPKVNAAAAKVEAHADKRGSDQINDTLSKARAEVIVDYLSRKGIERKRLTPEGKGSHFPLDVDNPTNPLNRRAEFVVSYPAGAKIAN